MVNFKRTVLAGAMRLGSGLHSVTHAQVPFACGPVLFGGATCTSTLHGALLATGTSYINPTAFALDIGGGITMNSPTVEVTASSFESATVNVAGGVNVR